MAIEIIHQAAAMLEGLGDKKRLAEVIISNSIFG